MPHYSIVLRDKNGNEMPEGLSAGFRSSVEHPDKFEAELLMQFSDSGGLTNNALDVVQSFEVYNGYIGKGAAPKEIKPCLVRSREEMRDLQNNILFRSA